MKKFSKKTTKNSSFESFKVFLKSSVFVDIVFWFCLGFVIFTGLIGYTTYLNYQEWGFNLDTIEGIVLLLLCLFISFLLIYVLFLSKKGDWFQLPFFLEKKSN